MTVRKSGILPGGNAGYILGFADFGLVSKCYGLDVGAMPAVKRLEDGGKTFEIAQFRSDEMRAMVESLNSWVDSKPATQGIAHWDVPAGEAYPLPNA